MSIYNIFIYKFHLILLNQRTALINYKLKIQYDGSAYAGWQIQNNAETIQEKLISSVNLVTGEKINLIGSGRTDAGVHAF